MTGWSGAISSSVRSIAVAVKRSLDGSLRRLTPFVSARARDRDRSDTGGVAGQDVDEARGKGAHSTDASRWILDGGPAVEAVTTNLLFDLELERRAVEHAAERTVRGVEDARAEGIDCDARLERPGHVFVLGRVQMLAELDEEVDDLGDGHVERRSGFDSWPDELIEVEGRSEEARVLGSAARCGHGDRASLYEVRYGERDRGRFEGAHAMLPRTNASMVPAHVSLSSPPSRSV